MRVYDENQPIGSGQPRGGRGCDCTGHCHTFPRRSHLKMVRFLEKFKFGGLSKKPNPGNAQANQTTNSDAECGKDAKGEYLSRKSSADKTQMGLIRPLHQTPTAEGVLGSRFGTERSRINNFLPRIARLRLLGMVATRVSAVGSTL